MTKEWYNNHGYAVSANLEQSVIDRAERDVLNNYVRPIFPNATGNEEGLKHPIADIAFLAIMQRNFKITRSGAKVKQDENSRDVDITEALREQSTLAQVAVEKMRKMTGAIADAQVTDVLRIYFRTYLLGY